MDSRVLQVLLVLVYSQCLVVFSVTDSNDLAALLALRSSWNGLPENWVGGNPDPCGSGWTGVTCNNTRVISLNLADVGLEGNSISDVTPLTELQILDLSNNIGLRATLPSDIGNLRNLTALILIGCRFFGPIPDSVGSLQRLVYISLSSNEFTGQIPPSIGSLSRLSWLDLSYNQLQGPIPVSSGNTPGLDMLRNARHFHFSSNQLSGPIPAELFSSNMSLIHLIFDDNRLTGNLPISLGFIQNLEVIRFDRNSLDGPIPPNLSNVTSLNELYLSDNNFNGNIPNLTGLNLLSYMDMSNNSFEASEIPPWLSTLQSLTTIRMHNTRLQGNIPVSIFGLPQLETLDLSNNNLNGTLDIGSDYATNVTLVLQNNSITEFQQSSNYNMEIGLVSNPICNTNGATARFCSVLNQPTNVGVVYTNNCEQRSCERDSVLSPNCQCSRPHSGIINFFSNSFSNFQNLTYFTDLSATLESVFNSSGIPVDSVAVSDVNLNFHLELTVLVFPSGPDSFNDTSISTINFLLNRQTQVNLSYYGPFIYIREPPVSRNPSNRGLIIGLAVGCSVLLLLIVLIGAYAIRQKRRAKRAIRMSNPFADWDPDTESGAVPQLQGAKWFSFEDLRRCTNNFSETNCIGSGGYGKVYKATVASSQVVAIKRAQQGSMQGASEFKMEIELLSRIHHKNVVNLVGFCYEQGEQMLVYEYVSNGTLKDCLSGKSRIRLDWNRRLKIAVDAARGLHYLHELADPPIIHRDVKTTNILLDNSFSAKVADFGLSKILGDVEKSFVSTQVKGTLGYMDPEYYHSQQLSEKSDVYSFGVVLLELITGRPAIYQGTHIVRFVKEAIENSKQPKSLDQITDPILEFREQVEDLWKFIDLAMSCVRDAGIDRPSMGEIVREIEDIMQLAARVRKHDTVFSSSRFEEKMVDSPVNSYSTSEGFDTSYGSFPFHVEQRQ